jgi:drug/metabolite transporter (DMT)-like permease
VHGLGLGGVFTAISQGVPAGISALIPGLQPIVTSILANRFMGEKVARLQLAGLALGLVGFCLSCTTATSCWRALSLAGLQASCR